MDNGAFPATCQAVRNGRNQALRIPREFELVTANGTVETPGQSELDWTDGLRVHFCRGRL